MSDDPNSAPAPSPSPAITVVHAPERHRYELRDNGTTIGFADYHLRSTGQVVFTHTEVEDAYSGQGLASELARFALDDVRAGGRRIVPICPYIAAYLRRHHDYDDLVDLPPAREAATG
jgi:uncharacterized protein